MQSICLTVNRRTWLLGFVSRGTSVRRRRALCAALVVAFAAGQIAGAAHDATTEHARCSEHGELIDLPAPPSGTSGDTRIAGTKSGPTPHHEHWPFPQAL